MIRPESWFGRRPIAPPGRAMFAPARAARYRCADETATMSAVRLSIQAQLCGPISVGTVKVIRLVSEHARLTLSEAAKFVDRCVFDGETVLIPMPSPEAASLLVDALRALPEVPRIEAS